jgi:hypothetical protein
VARRNNPITQEASSTLSIFHAGALLGRIKKAAGQEEPDSSADAAGGCQGAGRTTQAGAAVEGGRGSREEDSYQQAEENEAARKEAARKGLCWVNSGSDLKLNR